MPFRLDTANARLSRDGQVLQLRPKTLAVLKFLLMNPYRLLTKAELLNAVWGHRHVSGSVLEGCISELRKALGDNPRTPRYIETAPRRGYRFLAAVQREDSTVPACPPRHTPLRPCLETAPGDG
ncbi:transcriptional regulator [Methylococcus sp. Mc7]|jgi:DNA-binding winged helix-turn-helix (wHTH) protein|uniref:winged helix-turn-helix domain-containing protein n=1 Tax=Methylococcus sp. Mc7 TaxID=2860258 RepID=UPI001C52CCDE|nr:transcriptional regulator [Methylococcus sp. Mc7]QXP85469.1 transcriptional regulator [Methylococcus sp. Mc7]